MNRNLASSLVLAGTTAVAATLMLTVARNARADDITIDPHPFVGTRTRAEVRDELRNGFDRTGPTEWTLQQAPRPQAPVQQVATAETPQSRMATAEEVRQARSEKRASWIQARKQTSEMNSEDSGSSYMWKMKPLQPRGQR